MESFRTIAELSKNAKKSTGIPNKAVLHSCNEVPKFRLKNCLKTIKSLFLKPIRNCRTIAGAFRTVDRTFGFLK